MYKTIVVDIDGGDRQGSRLAAAALLVVVERTAASAGDALIALAADYGAGLMVAGVYGHIRYREWGLGGVTRELLERARVPLLIVH